MEALAATIVGSFLVPALKAGWDTVSQKVAEAFGQEAGEQTVGLTKRLWGRVKDAFGGEPKEATALELFEEDPETYSTAVERLLAKRLEQDPDLARELEALVAEPVGGTAMTGAQIMGAENVGLVDLRQADLRHAHHLEIIGQKIGPADPPSTRGSTPGGA
jgi:hypothetical protein